MSEHHEVVVTRSGARAMRDRDSGEVMHPVVGPLVEAAALYVGPSRLRERLLEGPVTLFDVGLGAGSNAIAAWRLAESLPPAAGRLEIVSFDRTTDALALAARPEHAPAFALDGPAAAAVAGLLAGGRHETERTRWRLVPGELPDGLGRAGGAADVVFWDPFSPRANPSLWTLAAFAALRRALAPRATVHTYSAATATRAALLLAGLAVGRGAPIGLKRETTVAAVERGDLAEPLDDRWLARFERSSAPLPPDAPAEAAAHIGRVVSSDSSRCRSSSLRTQLPRSSDVT